MAWVLEGLTLSLVSPKCRLPPEGTRHRRSSRCFYYNHRAQQEMPFAWEWSSLSCRYPGFASDLRWPLRSRRKLPRGSPPAQLLAIGNLFDGARMRGELCSKLVVCSTCGITITTDVLERICHLLQEVTRTARNSHLARQCPGAV